MRHSPRTSDTRQRESKDGAAAGAVGRIDRPTVSFDNPPTDRQAQPRAALSLAWPNAEELFKDAALGARRQPWPAIGDLDCQLLIGRAGDDVDRRLRGCVFNCVVEQVHQHLLNANAINLH